MSWTYHDNNVQSKAKLAQLASFSVGLCHTALHCWLYHSMTSSVRASREFVRALIHFSRSADLVSLTLQNLIRSLGAPLALRCRR